jgi:hypothetical protein
MAARVISETAELRFEAPRMLFEGGFAHDEPTRIFGSLIQRPTVDYS